jgi:hypothetical protein
VAAAIVRTRRDKGNIKSKGNDLGKCKDLKTSSEPSSSGASDAAVDERDGEEDDGEGDGIAGGLPFDDWSAAQVMAWMRDLAVKGPMTKVSIAARDIIASEKFLSGEFAVVNDSGATMLQNMDAAGPALFISLGVEAVSTAQALAELVCSLRKVRAMHRFVDWWHRLRGGAH